MIRPQAPGRTVGVADERRIARRRRLLVAAGLAPAALTLVAWAAFWAFANDEGVAGALYVLALSLPVALGFYAGAPLISSILARRASPERLDVVAPVVWCTLAAAAAGAGIVAVALTTSRPRVRDAVARPRPADRRLGGRRPPRPAPGAPHGRVAGTGQRSNQALDVGG